MATAEPPPPQGAETSVFARDSAVPPRAVLTELARGFLLTQDSDRGQATQFAASFLRAHAGPPQPERVVSIRHIAALRRGVAAAAHGQQDFDPSPPNLR